MAKAPWFRFYHGDYLLDADVAELPLEAQGIFVRIMCLCARDGAVPTDSEKLALRCGVKPEVMQVHMQNLYSFFMVDGDHMHSERMERERSDRNLISASRSKAAKAKHSKARAALASAKGVQSRTRLATANTLESESESESEVVPISPTPLSRTSANLNHDNFCHVPESSDLMVTMLVGAHPRNESPGQSEREAMEAIIRESEKFGGAVAAYEYLLERTKLYADLTSQWPEGQKDWIVSAHRWFADKRYRADENLWKRGSSTSEADAEMAARCI